MDVKVVEKWSNDIRAMHLKEGSFKGVLTVSAIIAGWIGLQ